MAHRPLMGAGTGTSKGPKSVVILSQPVNQNLQGRNRFVTRTHYVAIGADVAIRIAA